jgi:hypothetical protein
MLDRANTTAWSTDTKIGVDTAHKLAALSQSRQARIELESLRIAGYGCCDLLPLSAQIGGANRLTPGAELDMSGDAHHARPLTCSWTRHCLSVSPVTAMPCTR